MAQLMKANILRNILSKSQNVRSFGVSSVRNEIFTIQDEKDFDAKVMKSDRPIIVNFKATWCGPCKMLTPRLEKLMGAPERKDKVHFAMIDIDDNAEIAMEFSIDAVPAVLSFKNGKLVDKFIGLKDDDQLKAFIDKVAK